MRYLIREFRPGDVEAAVGMWRQTEGVLLDVSDSPERVRRFLGSNEGLSFVAADEHGRLIGSILCGHDTRRGYIYHLAVSKGARRMGIGRSLAGSSLAALAGQGVHKCHIHVLTANQFAESFWPATGWTRREDIATFSALTDR